MYMYKILMIFIYKTPLTFKASFVHFRKVIQLIWMTEEWIRKRSHMEFIKKNILQKEDDKEVIHSGVHP